MKSLIYSRETWVFLILVAVTVLSLGVGIGHGDMNWAANPTHQAGMLIVLAFIKVRLIIRHFMEVGAAPLMLQISCDAWLVSTCATLVFISAGSLS